MNSTVNTVELLSSLKKFAGASFTDEALALNLIQKAFEKDSSNQSKKPNDTIILRVDKYHQDDLKIGVRIYPMNDTFKSWVGISWFSSLYSKLEEKTNEDGGRSWFLHTTKKQLEMKKIDIEKCRLIEIQ